jgi:hypothetical protein
VKYLTPWRNNEIYKLGEKDPFVRIVPNNKTTYTTVGLMDAALDRMSYVGGTFIFDSIEAAQIVANMLLTGNGFTILSEEQCAKLEILI